MPSIEILSQVSLGRWGWDQFWLVHVNSAMVVSGRGRQTISAGIVWASVEEPLRQTIWDQISIVDKDISEICIF